MFFENVSGVWLTDGGSVLRDGTGRADWGRAERRRGARRCCASSPAPAVRGPSARPALMAGAQPSFSLSRGRGAPLAGAAEPGAENRPAPEPVCSPGADRPHPPPSHRPPRSLDGGAASTPGLLILLLFPTLPCLFVPSLKV